MFRHVGLSLCIFSYAVLIGCAGKSGPETDHEHEAISVTLWTEKTELFMEHPVLVVGQVAAFAVHLSEMKNFKPVIQGKLTCVFKKEGDDPVIVVADAPSYPGIFRPVVTFKQAGVYDMQLDLQGEQVSDTIRVPGVRVYADEAAVPHTTEADAGEQFISYLKEQQWKVDFRTEPARKRKLSASVQAVGEILPQLQMHAEVPAPVNGVILADQNVKLPSVGQWVNRNDILAVISPPANTESSFNSIRSEYLIASAEYERAQRLFEKQAISQKRLDEARLRFETRKAGYDVVSSQVDFSASEKNAGAAAMHFRLKPPISGIIQEIHFHLGQNVKTGEKLFTITNPKSVILKVHVPVARIAQTKNASDASFRIEGYVQEFKVRELNGRLVSIGSIVDEKSRTVPVTFKLDNPDNVFKIGMFAEVSVKTGESVEAIAIPNSAIFDDNGTPVAYVHVEGESFAKRILATGITDDGYTQILSGITEGERVTTIWGYQVRLASLSTSVPTGHGHEH